jgi:CRISPR-associated protein Csx16
MSHTTNHNQNLGNLTGSHTKSTTWFVSRHPGAIEWAKRHQLCVDQWAPHLTLHLVQPGDTVIGSLPVNLAAQVCALGARYGHLSLELPAHLRGVELSADQLDSMETQIQWFHIESTPAPMSD